MMAGKKGKDDPPPLATRKGVKTDNKGKKSGFHELIDPDPKRPGFSDRGSVIGRAYHKPGDVAGELGAIKAVRRKANELKRPLRLPDDSVLQPDPPEDDE